MLPSEEKQEINFPTFLVNYNDDFQNKEGIFITYIIGLFIGIHFFTSLTVFFESVIFFLVHF